MDKLFKNLGLSRKTLKAIEAKGYKEPTPIQEEAIPIILSGSDLIASAQTGTGKTAAFALPILSLLKKRGKPHCLVLGPTRELVIQVDESFNQYGKYSKLNRALLYGGVPYSLQREQLDQGADIIIATPGRLIDHIERGNLLLDDIEILVLDEVDRMLDMGFIDDVRYIIRQCPQNRQTLLFSATIPETIKILANWALNEPQEVIIGPKNVTADTIMHAIYPVDSIQRFDLLLAILKQVNYSRMIIFSSTKADAERIVRSLKNNHHSAVIMHSNRTQLERQQALNLFRTGKCNVLVATDVASRGLDIPLVSHVVNYDVPRNPEDYVHRIGRTGRADQPGEAFTLFALDEMNYLREIEKYIGKKIEQKKLDDFPYRNDPLIASKALPKKRNRGFMHQYSCSCT